MRLKQAGRGFTSFVAPTGKIKLMIWYCTAEDVTVNRIHFEVDLLLDQDGCSKLNEGIKEWHSSDQTTCPVVNWYHMTTKHIYFLYNTLYIFIKSNYMSEWVNNRICTKLEYMLYSLWEAFLIGHAERKTKEKVTVYFLFNPHHQQYDICAKLRLVKS